VSNSVGSTGGWTSVAVTWSVMTLNMTHSKAHEPSKMEKKAAVSLLKSREDCKSRRTSPRAVDALAPTIGPWQHISQTVYYPTAAAGNTFVLNV